MKSTLQQLQTRYQGSVDTLKAIQEAIKDYGDTMTAMMIVGKPVYDRRGIIGKVTRLAGVDAVEIYSGAEVGHDCFVNVVVVNEASC